MPDRLRWGILGAASIAIRRLIPAIARSQTGALAAIASRDEKKAAQFSRQFGIPRAYGSYEALLDDPGVDAVYIPLPNSLHRPWTERAAAARKHVLCEKPLGVNAAEAAAMVASCEKAGVVLQEAFMYRFHPQIERMQQLLREGAAGPLWLVRAAFSFGVMGPNVRLEAELGGGGLLDVGCYCVNISRLVLGEPNTAFASAVYERGVDVRLAGALCFAEERMALVDCGLRTPYRQECEIVGADGSITLPRPFQPEEDPAVLLVRRRRGEQEERIEVPGTNQYVRMIDHFAAIVRGAPPRYPAQDAVATMRILDALARSARVREPVDVTSR